MQLYSKPLSGNSFAIDHLGNLPVSCALELIPSSLFLEMMTTFFYNNRNILIKSKKLFENIHC
jgi:hypothetical protein